MTDIASKQFTINGAGRRCEVIQLRGCIKFTLAERREYEATRQAPVVPVRTKHRPWFPLYPGDYLANTRDLTVEQHGVYMLLLMCAWLRSDCALPNDKDFLRGILPHMHGLTFNRLVPPILGRFFELGPDNKYRQKRPSKEADKARELGEKQRRNVEERWKKIERNESETSKNINLGDTTVIPLQLQPHREVGSLDSGPYRTPKRESLNQQFASHGFGQVGWRAANSTSLPGSQGRAKPRLP